MLIKYVFEDRKTWNKRIGRVRHVDNLHKGASSYEKLFRYMVVETIQVESGIEFGRVIK